MGQLHEMALNGLGLGSKASDIDQMHKDHKAAGAHLAAELLLKIGVALLELESAERQAANAYRSLRQAADDYNENSSVANAEWLTHYAKDVEKHARAAQATYSKVGEFWNLYRMTQEA